MSYVSVQFIELSQSELGLDVTQPVLFLGLCKKHTDTKWSN